MFEGFPSTQQIGDFQVLESGTPVISCTSVALRLLHLSTRHKHSPVENKVSYSLTALKQYKAMNRLLILLSHLWFLELDADLLEGRDSNLQI